MFVLGHDGADAFALLLKAAENVVEFELSATPAAAVVTRGLGDPEQKVVDRSRP
jgi:isoamylase